MLVCFTAAALISLSLLEFGLYLAECHKNHAPVGLVHSGLLLVLFVLGMAALIRPGPLRDGLPTNLTNERRAS